MLPMNNDKNKGSTLRTQQPMIIMPTIVDPAALLAQVATTTLPSDVAGMQDNEPILQGYLKKESPGSLPATTTTTHPSSSTANDNQNNATVMASWKRRWFILRKGQLIWRKSQHGTNPSSTDPTPANPPSIKEGSISIMDIVGIFTEPQHHHYPSSIPSSSSSSTVSPPVVYPPNSFQLIMSNGKILNLQAPLEAAKKHWLTAIAATMVHCQMVRLQIAEQAIKDQQQQQQIRHQQVLSTAVNPTLDITTLADLPLDTLTNDFIAANPIDGNTLSTLPSSSSAKPLKIKSKKSTISSASSAVSGTPSLASYEYINDQGDIKSSQKYQQPSSHSSSTVLPRTRTRSFGGQSTISTNSSYLGSDNDDNDEDHHRLPRSDDTTSIHSKYTNHTDNTQSRNNYFLPPSGSRGPSNDYVPDRKPLYGDPFGGGKARDPLLPPSSTDSNRRSRSHTQEPSIDTNTDNAHQRSNSRLSLSRNTTSGKNTILVPFEVPVDTNNNTTITTTQGGLGPFDSPPIQLNSAITNPDPTVVQGILVPSSSVFPSQIPSTINPNPTNILNLSPSAAALLSTQQAELIAQLAKEAVTSLAMVVTNGVPGTGNSNTNNNINETFTNSLSRSLSRSSRGNSSVKSTELPKELLNLLTNAGSDDDDDDDEGGEKLPPQKENQQNHSSKNPSRNGTVSRRSSVHHGKDTPTHQPPPPLPRERSVSRNRSSIVSSNKPPAVPSSRASNTQSRSLPSSSSNRPSIGGKNNNNSSSNPNTSIPVNSKSRSSSISESSINTNLPPSNYPHVMNHSSKLRIKSSTHTIPTNLPVSSASSVSESGSSSSAVSYLYMDDHDDHNDDVRDSAPSRLPKSVYPKPVTVPRSVRFRLECSKAWINALCAPQPYVTMVTQTDKFRKDNWIPILTEPIPLCLPVSRQSSLALTNQKEGNDKSASGKATPTGTSSSSSSSSSVHIPTQGLGKLFSTGVILAGLIERSLPSMKLEGITQRARTRAVCINNLEKGLQVLWKTGVKSSKIPTADILADGKDDTKVAALLPELLDTLALRSTKQQYAFPALRWIYCVYRHYTNDTVPFPLQDIEQILSVRGKTGNPAMVHTSIDYTGLWDWLRNGLILCMIGHLYAGDSSQDEPDNIKHGRRLLAKEEDDDEEEGVLPSSEMMNNDNDHVAYAAGKDLPVTLTTRVDMSHVYVTATSRAQRRSNVRLGLAVLTELGCRLVLTEELLLGSPLTPTIENNHRDYAYDEEDDDLALYQVHLLAEALAHKQPALHRIIPKTTTGTSTGTAQDTPLPEGVYESPQQAHDEAMAGLLSSTLALSLPFGKHTGTTTSTSSSESYGDVCMVQVPVETSTFTETVTNALLGAGEAVVGGLSLLSQNNTKEITNTNIRIEGAGRSPSKALQQYRSSLAGPLSKRFLRSIVVGIRFADTEAWTSTYDIHMKEDTYNPLTLSNIPFVNENSNHKNDNNNDPIVNGLLSPSGLPGNDTNEAMDREDTDRLIPSTLLEGNRTTEGLELKDLGLGLTGTHSMVPLMMNTTKEYTLVPSDDQRDVVGTAEEFEQKQADEELPSRTAVASSIPSNLPPPIPSDLYPAMVERYRLYTLSTERAINSGTSVVKSIIHTVAKDWAENRIRKYMLDYATQHKIPPAGLSLLKDDLDKLFQAYPIDQPVPVPVVPMITPPVTTTDTHTTHVSNDTVAVLMDQVYDTKEDGVIAAAIGDSEDDDNEALENSYVINGTPNDSRHRSSFSSSPSLTSPILTMSPEDTVLSPIQNLSSPVVPTNPSNDKPKGSTHKVADKEIGTSPVANTKVVKKPTSPVLKPTTASTVLPPVTYPLPIGDPAVLAARERSMMVREEKFAWEKMRRQAVQNNVPFHIPLRGGLFALSSRTQPVRMNKHPLPINHNTNTYNHPGTSSTVLRDSNLSTGSDNSPNKSVNPLPNTILGPLSNPKYDYTVYHAKNDDDDDDDDDPIIALIEVDKTIDNIIRQPINSSISDAGNSKNTDVSTTEAKPLQSTVPPPVMTAALVTAAIPAPKTVNPPPSLVPSSTPSLAPVTANGLPLSLVPYRIFYLRTRNGLKLTSFKVSPVPNSMPWLPPMDYQITWGIPDPSSATNVNAAIVRTEGTLRLTDIASIRSIPNHEMQSSFNNSNSNILNLTNGIGYSLKVSPMNIKASKATGGLFVIDMFGTTTVSTTTNSSSATTNTTKQQEDTDYFSQLQNLYNQVIAQKK